MVRRQRAVLLAADRDRDDDWTRRLPFFLLPGRLEDALEQLAAVGRCRAGPLSWTMASTSFCALVV